MERLALSCCYILRNEELFLGASLQSVCPWVQELILLDSGSTDQTEAIARRFQSEVPDFVWTSESWQDNYSHARNRCAQMAKQPWILFVDGDETLGPEAPREIARLCESSEAACYSLLQRNYTFDGTIENAQPIQTLPISLPASLDPQQPLFYFENHMERLFRNHLGIEYRGIVHESVIPACDELNLIWKRTNLVLHHFGRLKAHFSQKLHYYLRLSQNKWQQNPEDPVTWIEYLVALLEVHEIQAAFELSQKALERFPGSVDMLRLAYKVALRAERYPVAERLIRQVLSYCPGEIEAKAQLTTALLYQGRFGEMTKLCEALLEIDPHNFVAHLNWAVLLFEQKNWKEALAHLEAAHQERPHDGFVLEALKKVRAELQTP